MKRLLVVLVLCAGMLLVLDRPVNSATAALEAPSVAAIALGESLAAEMPAVDAEYEPLLLAWGGCRYNAGYRNYGGYAPYGGYGGGRYYGAYYGGGGYYGGHRAYYGGDYGYRGYGGYGGGYGCW